MNNMKEFFVSYPFIVQVIPICKLHHNWQKNWQTAGALKSFKVPFMHLFLSMDISFYVATRVMFTLRAWIIFNYY